MLGRILASAGILALAAFLLVQFGTAREREGRAAERAARAVIDLADARAEGDAKAMQERRVADAVTAWGERKDALKPLILTSHDTVTQYAQTPAGSAPCLGADRVRGLDVLDAALFGSSPAGPGSAAVQADAGGPPARR